MSNTYFTYLSAFILFIYLSLALLISGCQEKRPTSSLLSESTKNVEAISQKSHAEDPKDDLITIATILIVGTFLFLVFAIYYGHRTYRWHVQERSKINSEKMVELLKSKSLEVINERLEGQEQERKRIARDLHDNLGGLLAAVRIELEVLEKYLKDFPQAREQYVRTYQQLSRASNETRRLSHDMMGLTVEHAGLVPSIQSLCQTFKQQSDQSQIPELQFSANIPSNIRLLPQTQLYLYRIVQELLQNVLKHAQASLVSLQIYSDEDSLSLTMEDDGQGFEYHKNQLNSGIGLGNIFDRVKRLEGKFDIDSQIGRGTIIMIEIPLKPSSIIPQNP